MDQYNLIIKGSQPSSDPMSVDECRVGASGNVWRNIYTGDLHLSNEAKDEGNRFN